MQVALSRKTKLFWLFFSIVLLVGGLVAATGKTPTYKKGSSYTYDLAVSGAIDLYRRQSAAGVNMAKGPCLSNDLMPGWVVDVVHSPREEIDNLPENQCPAFGEGRASHFVELDTNGNLVRVR